MFKNIIRYRHNIFYYIVEISLTVYVLLNWEKCIKMQFFSHFDGNNILFIVWIIIIFLAIYDVEAKGIKFQRHEVEQITQNFGSIEKDYTLKKIQNKKKQLNLLSQEVKNDGVLNKESDCWWVA